LEFSPHLVPRLSGVGKRRGDAFIDRAWHRRWLRAPVDDLERQRIGAFNPKLRAPQSGRRLPAGAALDL
jgi:hypothetical protein